MEKSIPPSAKKQIRNLLGVLTAGVGAAIIFALFMLYFYGPTGRYYLKNVLLSPETINQLSYEDTKTKKAGQIQFNFDKIEYTFWNSEKKEWKTVQVPLELYKQFYQSVQDESSILDVKEDVVNLFSKSNPSSLILSAKTAINKTDLSKDPKPFQRVQFVNAGDYFRVELREQNDVAGWAYFYHQNIYEKAGALFMQKGLSP